MSAALCQDSSQGSVSTWVYALIGATVGTVEAVISLAKHEAATCQAVAAQRAHEVLGTAHHVADETVATAAHGVYRATGACAGALAGGKYAVHALWWWATEDEIKLRLLQGSPVKYRLKDLDFRGIAAAYPTTGGDGRAAGNAGNAAPGEGRPPVSVAMRPASCPPSRAGSRPSSRNGNGPPAVDYTTAAHLAAAAQQHADSPHVLA